MPTPPIDLADIQGDILQAYGNRYRHTSYIFVGVGDPTRGRTAQVGERRPCHDRGQGGIDRRPDSTFNVALTSAGLAALGVPPATVRGFSDEFCKVWPGEHEAG